MEGLFGILEADNFVVGAVLVEDQFEGMHALLGREASEGATAQEDTLVGRGEASGDDARVADDGEGDEWMEVEATELVTLGAAVKVDAVGGGLEGVADGDAVASGGVGVAGLDEGQESVFALAEDLQGVGLIEEAILPTDGGVIVFHNQG